MIVEVKNLKALNSAMERLSEYLSGMDIPEDNVFDSKLVVSELVGNVLRHSDGTASFESRIDGGFIEIKVHSTARTQFMMPEKCACADVYSEGGRGLFIVDAVCTERGMTENGDIRVRIKINVSECPEK